MKEKYTVFQLLDMRRTEQVVANLSRRTNYSTFNNEGDYGTREHLVAKVSTATEAPPITEAPTTPPKITMIRKLF